MRNGNAQRPTPDSERSRVAGLKARGVDVCDMACAACRRKVCTGAVMLKKEAPDGATTNAGVMKATLTAYYNRDPEELVVDKPVGDWMKFDFKTGNPEELERVAGIVKAGGAYLTSGNFEFAFQV